MATTIHSPQLGSRFGGRPAVVGLAALAASIAIGAAGLAVRDRTSPTAAPAAIAATYLVKADRWYLDTVSLPTPMHTTPMSVKADRWYLDAFSQPTPVQPMPMSVKADRWYER